MGVLRLKDFIRAIRACKTAADERAVIAKESALIRTSFKEDSSLEVRHVNIAKMLYIHMLGHPTHFGQIECLKLVAGGKYADKRLGYLGIMLLLDESQEVLTLVTNSLKNDMNSQNMYVVGLALATMGNIASAEMARDLAPEVEKLLGSSNSYVKKKAALCAVKCLRKVPDLVDQFLPRAKLLINEKNHAALLTGMALIHEICEIHPAALPDIRTMVPHLTRHLKALTVAGSSPEHDVSGVNDPFLQARILRLLRVLGRGDRAASEAMNDILAQVATNTEGTRNVGNAILYETCLTIMDIEADSGLRVLAVNILGRFLANADNNIRYVALNTLTKTVTVDINAVQRHRNTVLECLHDTDISIRRRALDLSFVLINESNVRVMIRELLVFLEVADAEFKLSMPPRICAAAELFAPNKRWHVDTIIRVFKLAGSFVKEDVLSTFIKIVASAPDLHAYSLYKLFYSLKQDLSQEALVLSAVWSIGEYGEILFSGSGAPKSAQDDVTLEENAPPINGEVKDVSERDVVDLLQTILDSVYNSTSVTEYVLAALLKLTVRVKDPQTVQRIQSLIRRYNTAVDVEIQQRSVEFITILTDPVLESSRAGILEHVPVPPPPTVDRRALQSHSTAVSPGAAGGGATNPAAPATSGGGLLDDLLSLDQPSATASAPGYSLPQQMGGLSVSGGAPAGQLDLLADVFGSSGGALTSPSAQLSRTKDDIMNLFGGGGGSGAQAAPAGSPTSSSNSNTANPLDILSGMGRQPVQQQHQQASSADTTTVTAYQKNGLTLSMRYTFEAPPDKSASVCVVQSQFRNTSAAPVTDLSFQVAVPKNLKLQLLPPSGSVVPPNGAGTVNQVMKILNPVGGTAEGKSVPMRLKLKVAYVANGGKVDEIVDFNGFGGSFSW